MKTCSRCGAPRDESEFRAYARSADGLFAWCKPCAKEYAIAYRAAHPGKAAEATKRYRLAHQQEVRDGYRRYRAEHLEQRREKDRIAATRRRAENPDKAREITRKSQRKTLAKRVAANREWREKNRDLSREYCRRWYEKNTATSKAKNHRRRAREHAGGSFTKREWLDLCDVYGNACLACHSSVPLTPDHVVPLAKGGSNEISNIQPLCLKCNLRKGTETVDYRPKSKGQAV